MKVQRAAASMDHSFAQLPVEPPAPMAATVEVSEPDDASERDADRMAEQALSSAAVAPVAPAVGGRPQLARAVDEEVAPAAAGSFLVEDDAATLLPGQMRKGAFLHALRAEACAAANRELARAGRDTEGCPYLEHWFDYYEHRDARQVERALRKYAPDAAQATSAADYIPIVSARAAQAARQWAQTGALPEMPEGMAAEMMGGGLLGAIGGAIGGALSAIGGLFFKADGGGARGGVDRGALEARLGPGQPLDGGAQSRMGAALGHDFSRVRVHTDHDAARAASGLNARAFALGQHVAFGTGEYRPGSVMGDALLAHELAHVVQQGAASPTSRAVEEVASPEAEHDADRVAAGVVLELHAGARPRRRRARPTGLRLQRCHSAPQKDFSTFLSGADIDELLADDSIIGPRIKKRAAGGINAKTNLHGLNNNEYYNAASSQLSPPGFSQQQKLADAQNTPGFTNPTTGQSYYSTGYSGPGNDTDMNIPRSPTTTPVHEVIHEYGSPAFLALVGTKGNEGTTEFFTRRILNQQKGVTREGYEAPLACVQLLAKEVGEEVLADAFFLGDIAGLRKEIDAKKLTAWIAAVNSDDPAAAAKALD